MQLRRELLAGSAALLLGCLPLVAAHGDDHGSMDMSGAHETVSNQTAPADPNYFTHPKYAGWIYAHIALMTTAWFGILPIGK